MNLSPPSPSSEPSRTASLSGWRQRSLLVLLLAVTALVVGLGALSFVRKIDSFQPTGVELMRSSGSWVVRSAYEASGLLPGDVVNVVNGEFLVERAAIEDSLRRRSESDLLVVRGAELVPVRHPLPPLRIDASYLVLALIGAVYLFIGLFTLRRGLTRETVLFQLWCMASAAVYLLTNLPARDLLDRTIYVGEEVARLLLPPLTLHFFLVFPRPLELLVLLRRWVGRAIPFLYLPSAALLAFQLDMIFTNGALFAGAPTPSRILLLDRLELYLLVGFAFAAVAALVTHMHQAEQWEQGRQVLWVTLGLAAGYLPFALLYAAPITLGLEVPEGIEVLAVLPLSLVPISFAYAILRYRLWDIAVIVRDVTTYTLTLLLGALGFSLLNLMIRRSIPDDLDLARNLATVTGGLLIAGLLVPAKNGIASTLQRFHYRGSFRRRRALSQLGQELLHERDLTRLSGGLLAELEEAMDLEHCNLLLVEEGRLVPVRPEALSLSGESLRVAGFDSDLWSRDWAHLSGPALAELGIGPEQSLFALGYRSAFPLAVRGRRVGLLLAGLKADRIPLNSDDCMLIRQLLNQAALAIENAQLLEQMQRQLREVVELKKFNEEIIESSPAGIAVLDGAHNIVSANLAFAALVGYERGALRRRPLREVLDLDHLPTAQQGVVEIRFVDRTGRERELQLSLASFVGDRARAVQVLVVNDVTELVEMERALEEKERLAALGVVAAGVAHEVNTPLTGISSYAQMLLECTAPEDPRHELLTKLERQTFRAAKIVNTLLELSRASREDARPVSLRATLDDILDLLGDRLKRNRIEVSRPSAAEEFRVTGSEGELQQVLTNLVINAMEALTEVDGARRMELELIANERMVEARVADNGPGIAKEHLSQVFRPFFSTKTEHGGTGLGLSISYEIVRRHGGEIGVANRSEGGCCFSVRLPRYPFVSLDAAAGAPALEQEASALGSEQ